MHALVRRALCALALTIPPLSLAPPARGDEPPLLTANGGIALDRAALIRAVLARNPRVAAAQWAWHAEQARYSQETALDDPVLSYSLRPRSFGSRTVDAANDFEISQALPFPGKRSLRGARARANADGAAGDLETERLDLAERASTLFDEYWLADRALETNARHQALLGEAQRVALARYAAGVGSQQDVLGIESESAMLLHSAAELSAARRNTASGINTLLQREPNLPLPPAPDAPLLAASRALDEPTLVAQALARRPELRARLATVRAREAEVALARREFLPDFVVRAGYESSWQENPLKTMVGIELNLPLQLGRRRAALEEAQATLAREKQLVLQVEGGVRLELAVAIERVREAQHLLEISQQLRLPPARDRLAGAQAAFASGQATLLELLDAERALREAELADHQARAAISIRLAELARALGEIAGAEETQQ